ncbi:hypothetical protein TEA_012361 [Camellia sinensis var. sinensis]|uniref:SAC9 first GBDL domain-containing protein n=1 Tax=Camellia sinensis var. sinensis TaxID=542762 RepID=A0A4S4DFR9_CAMSN|nr:hypothetical protein TEA_012361 [Camellia sinensis var. sinensis]
MKTMKTVERTLTLSSGTTAYLSDCSTLEKRSPLLLFIRRWGLKHYSPRKGENFRGGSEAISWVEEVIRRGESSQFQLSEGESHGELDVASLDSEGKSLGSNKFKELALFNSEVLSRPSACLLKPVPNMSPTSDDGASLLSFKRKDLIWVCPQATDVIELFIYLGEPCHVCQLLLTISHGSDDSTFPSTVDVRTGRNLDGLKIVVEKGCSELNGMLSGEHEGPCRRILFRGGRSFELTKEAEDQIGLCHLAVVERGQGLRRAVVLCSYEVSWFCAKLWERRRRWFLRLDKALEGRVGRVGEKGLEVPIVFDWVHRWWKSSGKVEVLGIGGHAPNSPQSNWIKVLGLLIHLRGPVVYRAIRSRCRGFVEVDELMDQLARPMVESVASSVEQWRGFLKKEGAGLEHHDRQGWWRQRNFPNPQRFGKDNVPGQQVSKMLGVSFEGYKEQAMKLVSAIEGASIPQCANGTNMLIPLPGPISAEDMAVTGAGSRFHSQDTSSLALLYDYEELEGELDFLTRVVALTFYPGATGTTLLTLGERVEERQHLFGHISWSEADLLSLPLKRVSNMSTACPNMFATCPSVSPYVRHVLDTCMSPPERCPCFIGEKNQGAEKPQEDATDVNKEKNLRIRR